jgi:O-antigen ligase
MTSEGRSRSALFVFGGGLSHRAQGPLLLLGLAAAFAAWLLSGHYPPWTAFQQQAMAALGAAFVALAAAFGPKPWRWPRVALALLFLALAPLAQHAFGQVTFLSDALLPAGYVIGFALCIAASANLSAQRPALWPQALLGMLLLAACASSVFGLIQWLGIEPPPGVMLDRIARGGRSTANLGQPNHLATLIGLGIATALYFLEQRRIGAVPTATLMLLLGIGLLTTQSRTAWLFLAVLVAWWACGRNYLRLRGWPIAVALTLFALGVCLWTPLSEALLLHAPEMSLEYRVSGGSRPALWRAMIEAIGNAPWLGWGWNQVSIGHLSVAYERPAGHYMLHNAHSIALDLPLWVGLPLGLTVLAGATWWLVRQVRGCRDSARWCLLLAVFAIGTHALTEYPLDYTYFLFTLGLLVGALHRWPEPVAPRAVAASRGKQAFVMLWAGCCALTLWIAAEYLEAEESARQVRMVLAGVGVDKVSHVAPPDVVLLDTLREYHRFWITPARAGMSNAEIDWMHRVMRRYPFPPAMLRYALAAGLNGRAEEATRTLRAICNVHPAQRCTEAREAWRAARAQFPVLAGVPEP